MSFPFGNMLGMVIEDKRMPKDELWLYTRPHPILGNSRAGTPLPPPAAKIVNIGENK
jgi:hypothetical protein